jgi:hypothetical protein
MQLYLFTSAQGQINHLAEIVNADYTEGQVVDGETVRIVNTTIAPELVLENYYINIYTLVLTAFPTKPTPTSIWDWSNYVWLNVNPNPALINVVLIPALRSYKIDFEITDTYFDQQFFGVEIHESLTANINNSTLVAVVYGNSFTREFTTPGKRYIWLRVTWSGGSAAYSSMITVPDELIQTGDVAPNALTETLADGTSFNLATIPVFEGLIGTYYVPGVTSDAGVLNCHVTSHVDMIATNTGTNLVMLYLEILVNGVITSYTSASYGTLPALTTLQTLRPVISIHNIATFNVPKDATVIIRIKGGCEDANKLELGAVWVQRTLLKK